MEKKIIQIITEPFDGSNILYGLSNEGKLYYMDQEIDNNWIIINEGVNTQGDGTSTENND